MSGNNLCKNINEGKRKQILFLRFSLDNAKLIIIFRLSLI